MKKMWVILIFIITIIGLSACIDDAEEAANRVETYLQALVAQEGEKVSSYSCNDWEAQAIMEMDSFQAVNPKLIDLDCQQTGSDGEITLVTCQGILVASYNDEQQEFDLNLRSYEVLEEGGDWRICGYR
jgi:hypothetical protein